MLLKEKLNVFWYKFKFQSVGGSGYISPQRYVEYAFAFHHLQNLPSTSFVLDVGSSHSLLPTWLVSEIKCNVKCIDPDEAFIKQKEFASKMGINSNLECVMGDGRKLPFKDKIFNVVTGISTIEHLEGMGDIKLFYEMVRVLKHGGVFLLTTPLCVPYMEHFIKEPVYKKKEKETLHFFEKNYDPETINKRFLSNPELEMTELKAFGIIKSYTFAFKKYLSPLRLRGLYELIKGLLCMEVDIASLERNSEYVACLLLKKKK